MRGDGDNRPKIFKLTFFIAAIVSLIQCIYQIFIEIKNKTFFAKNFEIIKNNSILLNDIFNSNYTIIDVAFDFLYMIKNLNKKFFFTSLLFIILLISTSWIPGIYTISLIINGILLLTKILMALIKNTELTINCDDEFELNKNYIYNIKKTIQRPAINAKLVLYFIIKRKNKFDPQIAQLLLINNILPKPLWFVRIIAYIANLIYDIAKCNDMKKKNIYGKIDVMKTSLNDEWTFYLLNKAIFTNFAKGKRLIIRDKKISTNLKDINQIIFEYWMHRNQHLKLIPTTVQFNSKNHMASLQNGIGIHYTSQESVKINGENVKTLEIPLTNYKQFALVGFYGEKLIKQKKLLKIFFENHGISNEQDFVGFWLKQKFFIENMTSDKLIFQDKNESKVLQLDKSITLLSHFYLHEKTLKSKNFSPKETAKTIWKEEELHRNEQNEKINFLNTTKEEPIAKIPEKFKEKEIINEAEGIWNEVKKNKYF